MPNILKRYITSISVTKVKEGANESEKEKERNSVWSVALFTFYMILYFMLCLGVCGILHKPKCMYTSKIAQGWVCFEFVIDRSECHRAYMHVNCVCVCVRALIVGEFAQRAPCLSKLCTVVQCYAMRSLVSLGLEHNLWSGIKISFSAFRAFLLRRRFCREWMKSQIIKNISLRNE